MSESTASMKADDSEKTKGKKGGTDRSYDIEEIRDIADLFDERGLTELEFELIACRGSTRSEDR